jgi:hypothetical protein
MISTERRKKFFDLLCSNSSPDFIEYLRIYENFSRSAQELFEASCELVNGIRVDSMRLAISNLHKQEVLRWIYACRFKIPLIEDLLFEDTKEACFGIGLADYPSGSGVFRMKIYNLYYGRSQSQSRKVAHIQQSFSLLNIPDIEFRKDLEQFRKVNISGIDWDCEGQAMIKVYFGPFPLEQLFGSLSEVFFKDEILCYDILRQKGLLPETFVITARYSRDGRSIRTDFPCRTRKFVPYLKMFDYKREVSKFFIDLYRIFPGLTLQVINMQWTPVQTTKFYFKCC